MFDLLSPDLFAHWVTYLDSLSIERLHLVSKTLYQRLKYNVKLWESLYQRDLSLLLPKDPRLSYLRAMRAYRELPWPKAYFAFTCRWGYEQRIQDLTMYSPQFIFRNLILAEKYHHYHLISKVLETPLPNEFKPTDRLYFLIISRQEDAIKKLLPLYNWSTYSKIMIKCNIWSSHVFKKAGEYGSQETIRYLVPLNLSSLAIYRAYEGAAYNSNYDMLEYLITHYPLDPDDYDELIRCLLEEGEFGAYSYLVKHRVRTQDLDPEHI